MNTIEHVKAICESRKIPISRLERDCGFGNGYFRQLKKIPDDRLARVAEYLDVSTDYLISGDKQKKPVSNGDELLEILEACRESEDIRAYIYENDHALHTQRRGVRLEYR